MPYPFIKNILPKHKENNNVKDEPRKKYNKDIRKKLLCKL